VVSQDGQTPAIGLLGDVMLGRAVGAALASEPADAVWAPDLRDLAQALDAVVCNLECCISERGVPTTAIPGKPFFFRAPPAAVQSLLTLGVRAVSLANNHALDFGEEALADTLELLHDAGIATAGAGFGAPAARHGAVVQAGGARVGIVALADHPEEYAAAGGRWGTAYADLRTAVPRWVIGEIERLRGEADLVLAFPHWGPNMTTATQPWQRERAAEMLAAGAGLVAGHSAHVFHGIEWRAGGWALYDLGDALDDYAVDAERRNDLGLMAIWRPVGTPRVELVGLRLGFACTGLAAGEDADWIAARLAAACARREVAIERVGESRFAVH
jgi:poly-gamma-glutamate synthesis protein (capsule biosynthesis protein)